MAIFRWLSRALTLVPLGALLVLAACGGASSSSGATPTSLPTILPTFPPPTCNANFPPMYHTTLPDATFKATTVYAQIPLPPETRAYDNDATGGVRGRQMCSAGITVTVLDFMTQHLTQLGWQQLDTDGHSCLNAGSYYGHSQCWKNGSYALFLGVNSSTDWIIIFRDPDFH